MFEFFIALFGGLFYSGKFMSEKSQCKEADKQFNERCKLNESIGKMVVASPELQKEVRDRLFKCRGKSQEHIEAIYDELRDDFEFAFGKPVNMSEVLWLSTVANMNQGKMLYKAPNRLYCWAYKLLLSHKGKVDDTLAYSNGFQLGSKDTLERDIRFCQRIEQNLNANGVGVKLYFEPKYSPDTKTYNQDPCAQRLVFEHQVYNKSISRRLW